MSASTDYLNVPQANAGAASSTGPSPVVRQRKAAPQPSPSQLALAADEEKKAAARDRARSGSAPEIHSPPSAAQVAKLLKDLRACTDELKTIEPAWEKRVRAISRLQSLVEDEGLFFQLTRDVLKDDIRQIRICLEVQLEDLRSGIVKQACSLLVGPGFRLLFLFCLLAL